MKKLLLFIIYITLFSSFNTQATIHLVTANNSNSFVPSILNINLGDTVEFTNSGGFHNVNATLASFPNNPQGFGNAVSSANWSFQHIFTVAGTYNYQCDPHVGMGMIGTITVNTPSIDSVIVTNASCNGFNDGLIQIDINQTAPATDIDVFLYLESPSFPGIYFQAGTANGPNNQFFINAGAGNYRVDIRTSSGIIPPDTTGSLLEQAFLSVTHPDSLVIQPVSIIDPTSILTSDGSIDISVSGGTPGYTYLWQEITNNFTASTEDLNNLPVGNYQLTVTDFNNCTISESWTLEATACFAGDVEIINVSCYAEQDGKIIITGAYGTGPLTFAIDTVERTDPNFPTQLYQNSLHTNPTGSGSWTFSNTSGPSNYSIPRRVGGEVYYYYFTSADSACADLRNNIGEIEVDRFGDPYQIDTLVTPSDFGASNGSIQVTVNSGGYPYDTTTSPHTYVGYSYSWFDASLNPISSNSSTLSISF